MQKKDVGMVRKVDELGRVVLPKELRKTLDMDSGTDVEILGSQNGILIRKYASRCFVCGGQKGLIALEPGKSICAECRKKMRELENIYEK